MVQVYVHNVDADQPISTNAQVDYIDDFTDFVLLKV